MYSPPMIYELGRFLKRSPERQLEKVWGMQKEAGREVGRDERDGKKAGAGGKGEKGFSGYR